MATYAVQGTCTISSSIEPDGRLELDNVENFQDNTSLWGQDIEFECEFGFDIEAASEEEARSKADDEVESYLSFYSNDNFEWEISDREITDVERASPEMTLAEALQVLQDWADNSNLLELDVREAIGVIFDAVQRLLAAETLRQAASETPFGPAEDAVITADALVQEEEA